MIYIIIGTCIIITGVLCYVAHILKKNGKQEYEIEENERFAKRMEEIRKVDRKCSSLLYSVIRKRVLDEAKDDI